MDLLLPFLDAVVLGEESTIEFYLQLGLPIEAKDDESRNALHWSAASEDGERLVSFLIQKGVNINAKDSLGFTPLHIHALKGRLYGVSCLLHAGADPNINSKDGHSPLQVAIKHRNFDIANLLIAYGSETTR